jgi:suppressor for copper-sensitivity B
MNQKNAVLTKKIFAMTLPMKSPFRLFSAPIALAVASALLASAAPVRAAESDWVKSTHVQARLLAVPAKALPADAANEAHAYGALDIALDSGWHSYWRMPGEGGLAPVVHTEGSQNLKEIKLIWPKPRRYETYGMYSFGYDNGFMLPFEIVPEKEDRPVRLTTALDIMICKDICVPETLKISLDVPPAPKSGDEKKAVAADAKLIAAGIHKAPVEKDMERLKIETIVVGPEALVATIFSQHGFKDSDMFVELVGAKQDIYLTAPPEVTVDEKDSRKAILKVKAPAGVGNLAKLIEGGKVIVTFVSGSDAVSKTANF